MTKKKRVFMIAFVFLSVIVGVGVFCFSYFGMYSNHRPKESGTAESVLAFDPPDKIVKFINGKEKNCSAEEINRIYDAFMSAILNVRMISSEKQPLTQSYIRKKKKTTTAFELRYVQEKNLNTALKYKGSDFSDSESTYVFENCRFDAVFVSLGSDSLFFALHSNKKYQGDAPTYMEVGQDTILMLSQEIF